MTLLGNIVTTVSGRIAVLGLALVSSIVLARGLGPEGRGVFALILLVPDLVTTFGHLGLQQANAVYAGLEPERRRFLVWQSGVAAGILGGGMAIAAAVFLVAGAPGFAWLVRAPLWLYLVLLLVVPGDLLTNYLGAILCGMNRIRLFNALEVGGKAASLVVLAAFIGWLRLGVVGAVLANVLITVVTVVVMASLLRRVGAWGKASFDRSFSGRTARFALSAYFATIMTYLNYRVDQFIVAAWLPAEQLGFYVIAVGLAERLWILPGALATALLPYLTNSRDRNVMVSAVMMRHAMIWVGAGCALLFLAADLVVRILYSSAFAPAVAPLRWLLPGVFALTAAKVLVVELLAKEKIHYTVWASAAAVLVNVVGNIVLLPRMGIAGAALASSVSYSVVAVFVIAYYIRETGLPWATLVPRASDVLTYGLFLRGLVARLTGFWAVRSGAP